MAVDLKVELFSADLFRILWHKLGLTNIIIPRLKNYNKASNEYACSYAIIEAVFLRKEFFQYTLCRKLFPDYEIYSTSSIDFYIYLQSDMNIFIAFDELNVFDRLLMTCAVVAGMVHICYVRRNEKHLTSAYLSWAMYFDTTLKEEFYAKGGWDELEVNATNINDELLKYYKVLTLEKAYYENDLLNAKVCFDEMSHDYSIPTLRSAFKKKFQSNKTSCRDCRVIFYAISAIYIEDQDVLNEFKYCECYLQIMKLMLTKEQIIETSKEVLRDPELKQMSEVFNVVLNPTEGLKCELLENKAAFYQQGEIYTEKYKALNSSVFLNGLFVSDSLLNDAQCIFCGDIVFDLGEALKSANDQVERIKSTICKTITDAREKDDESAEMLSEASKSQNTNQKNDGTYEALRLFFALGIKRVVPGILANLRERDNSSTDTQKVPEDKNKQNTSKKKNTKKKKNAK